MVRQERELEGEVGMASMTMGEERFAVLDLEPLTQAFGEFGDDVIDTLDLFLTSTWPLLEDVERLLAAEDLNGAGEAAHSAKGSANVSGAYRLGCVCAAVEIAALRNHDLAAARLAAAALPASFAEVKAEIVRVVGEARP
jgi:HPt (histidine-containing phosphotransfer) domain-containing protein